METVKGSDKPTEINLNANKLPGHDMQNWDFLCLFLLMFFSYLQRGNVILKLIIVLHEIVVLICAP